MIAFLSGHYIEVTINCNIEHCLVQRSIYSIELLATFTYCMMYITISEY